MSHMDGNTHFDAAALERPQLVTAETANEHYTGNQGLTDETMQFAALNRIAESTLALAYEQRTANLLHALEISYRAQGTGLQIDPQTIAARLGLNEEGATE